MHHGRWACYSARSSSIISLAILFLQTLSAFLAGESGSADTVRDPRGFAVKFYTDEGNWDLTGNNTPIFFIRDALLVRERQAEILISCTRMFYVCLLSFFVFLHMPSFRPSSTLRSEILRLTWRTLTWCGTFGACVRSHCIRFVSSSRRCSTRFGVDLW